MDRKELDYIRILNNKIDSKQKRIEELKSKAYPGAIRYDDTGGSKPMVFDTLGDLYAEIDVVEREANNLITQRSRLQRKAIHAIRVACEDNIKQRHVMYLRYLGNIPHTRINLEWPEVRKYMMERHKVQERKVYQIHHDALKRVNLYKI